MTLNNLLYVAIFSIVSGASSNIGPRATRTNTNKHSQKINTKMTTLTTYLLLDGDCKQAMEFYKSVFGGELIMIEVGNSPMKNYFPSTIQQKIVNAKLVSSIVNISASDWLRPNQTPVKGNMVCLYLSGGTTEELESLFSKLSLGADITDPLIKQPFGMYGALNDKFGIRWMFQTDK
jgi:PhnB protein